MKRRDFLAKSLGYGVLAGSSLPIGKINKLLAAETSDKNQSPDLVVVKGGKPDEMFDKGIASLGGIAKFVHPNQTVVVKPNIAWNRGPELGANTNPVLVARIVEHCLEVGAKEVVVFDHTCSKWQKTYKTSGIEKAVKDAGGKIATADNENDYREVTLSKGKLLKKIKIHKLALDTDVFINVPVLKDHTGGGNVTIAIKNLMGIIWDRMSWHKPGVDLHQCIADLATAYKPQLNVIDAYNVMWRNGPIGVSTADLINKKHLIISKDIVSADAAATKIIGRKPEDIRYIKLANEMGVGRINLQDLSIKRISI